MKKVFSEVKIVAVTVAALVIAGCSKDKGYGTTRVPSPTVNAHVISVTGDSAGIVANLDEFRLLAGTPLNTVPGAGAGRRAVNRMVFSLTAAPKTPVPDIIFTLVTLSSGKATHGGYADLVVMDDFFMMNPNS